MKLNKWPLLYIIPLLSVAILLFFTFEEVSTSLNYFIEELFITITITTTIWLVDALFFEKMVTLYPEYKHTFKRLVYTIVGFVFITLLVYTIDCFMICRVILKKPMLPNFLENIRITYIVTAMVYVVYECMFFFDNWKKAILYNEELKKEHTIAQYESLKNQINPHFLFNSLNTLAAIIPQDPDQAVDFVQKLSNSYRYLLKMKERELVTLDDELEFVHSYIFLIKSRYGNNIQISIDDQAERREVLLPPVSLQMLLENCIKHNVITKEKPLYIQISVESDQVRVVNNRQPKQMTEPSTGLGLENIRKRYIVLSNRKMYIYASEANFEVVLPLLNLNT
ncbi:MAG TPA: histidine kinase [Cytophagales bacterium]|nr:histidine kinase [Cytophagales bacterium]